MGARNCDNSAPSRNVAHGAGYVVIMEFEIGQWRVLMNLVFGTVYLSSVGRPGTEVVLEVSWSECDALVVSAAASVTVMAACCPSSVDQLG